MPNDRDPINSFAEQSNSSPKRTRPTDKQMGLGTVQIGDTNTHTNININKDKNTLKS